MLPNQRVHQPQNAGIRPAPASVPEVLERFPPTGPSLRILVVEDNIEAGDGLSRLLRMHSHEVLVARTGPSALEVASEFRPHVVLLDIGLPGMDGYQVAQRLREKPEFENVLLCSLSGFTPSDADLDRPLQRGFGHRFVRPVNLKTLFQMLEAVTLHLPPSSNPPRS